MSGRKLVGCCVHVATVIYYLSNAKYIRNNKLPAEYLNNVFIDMEKMESPNNPRYVQSIRYQKKVSSCEILSFSGQTNSEINSNEKINKIENSATIINSLQNNNSEPKQTGNKNKKKLSNKRNIKNDLNDYFLKLENYKNSCFANVILQGLLSIGDEFFKKVFNIYELSFDEYLV